MPKYCENSLRTLIGKVDLITAGVEPGTVLSEEMCEVVVEILSEVKKELKYKKNSKRQESVLT